MTNSIMVGGCLAPRLIRDWGINIVMCALLGALAIGSTWLDASASRPRQPVETDDLPDSGVIVQSEIVHLWLPEALIDLADSRCSACSARARQNLCDALDCRNPDKLWYAITKQTRQRNGDLVDLTYVRQVSQIDSQNYAELVDVLAAADGHPAREYSGADVQIVAGNLSFCQAPEVIRQLISGR
jgi:hypothetical protein